MIDRSIYPTNYDNLMTRDPENQANLVYQPTANEFQTQ